MNKIEILSIKLQDLIDKQTNIIDSEVIASLELVKYAILSKAWDESRDALKNTGFEEMVNEFVGDLKKELEGYKRGNNK